MSSCWANTRVAVGKKRRKSVKSLFITKKFNWAK
jgi:hypothetical protein